MSLILDEIVKDQTMNSMDLKREDFVWIYANSPGIIKFLENSIEETEYTKKVDALNVPSDFSIITFVLNKMDIDREDIQLLVKEKLSDIFDDIYRKIYCKKVILQERIVTIKMIDCGCFFQKGKKFPDFCEILTDQLDNKSKQKIFDSKFLQMMMLEYGSPY